LKKPAGSVRFYKQKTEKTEPNRTETDKKPEKTEPNRFEPVFALKNRTETSRFDLVSVFFKKKFSLVTFFDKNRIEPKMITPSKFNLKDKKRQSLTTTTSRCHTTIYHYLSHMEL